MDNRFEPLATGEVLSVDESVQILIGHCTFRAGEFSEALKTQIEYGISGWTSDKDAWFSEEGIPCEVLRFSSKGWQKGKVRIRLEFCPQDTEEEDDTTSASVESKPAPAVPVATPEELDFDESPFDSASFDDELSLSGTSDIESELDLGESVVDELDLGESVVDELDLGEPIAHEVDEADEFDFTTPVTSDFELEQEAPSEIYSQMEQESIEVADDELYMAQMPTSLDDDLELGEISQSIEQELEMVEPTVSDDDLLDLTDMSGESGDDLDFGEMSVGSEDDFEFEEISLSDESAETENEADSLLDDVWQDMNEASWQNH
ncbi:MAG TPA: KGK domain-containing protein [Coleofasciculaceae cyanobacterium]